MEKSGAFSAVLLTAWAGLSLGGNLIAAPAKFQVSALTTAELLMVGRAQFAWLGVAEYVFAATIIALALLNRQRPHWPVMAALAVFAIQQWILQPMLEARTDIRIAGADAGDSHLHLVFIATEVAKFIQLLWGSFRLFRHLVDPTPPNSQTP